MSTNHSNPNLGKCVPYVLKTCHLRTVALMFLTFLFGATLFAQRIVFPGQNLLSPYLNDPSYVGVENRVSVLGMLQLADFPRRQHSQYIFAQIPVSNKLSFGVDYFKDGLDVFTYSSAMASAAMQFQIGAENSYVRLGVSGGIDSRRQSAFPAEEIPNMETFVARLNEGDNSFAYRAGVHYTYNAFSLGVNFNRLPIQSTLARTDQEDLIGYWIKEGVTANLRYSIYLYENLRLTPMFRYLNYASNPIYEGALLVDVGDKFSASFSYKNEYSINPAVRYQFLDTFQVGYSYEKSFGDVTFEDIHSLSIAYRFEADGSEEPDWRRTAKENNRKIAAIKPKKEKKEKAPKPEQEVEKEAAEKEAAEKETELKETDLREAAQKEAEQKEALEREAAQREAAQKEVEQKEALEKEAAQKKAAEESAAEKEAAEREASPEGSRAKRGRAEGSARKRSSAEKSR